MFSGRCTTQANTGGRRGTSAKPAGPDEEDTTIIDGGEAARSPAVVFRGRLWQRGQEIVISVGVAIAVLEGVVERGEKLEPPLDSRIVASHFANAFECLVIRKYAKLVPQRLLRRRLMARTMLPAAKSSGVQCVSESRVARLI